MKALNLIIFFSIIILTSACSRIGSAVTSTGNYVSKAGSLISGDNGKQQQKPSVSNSSDISENAQKFKKIIPSLTTALVKINTTKTSNLRASGKPSRINITVLQLKSAGKFSTSRISSLRNDLVSTLGADFISQESVSILPNNEKILRFEIDPSTRVIGVFGSFSQLNNTIWKTSLNIPKAVSKLYAIQVLVDSKSVSARKN